MELTRHFGSHDKHSYSTLEEKTSQAAVSPLKASAKKEDHVAHRVIFVSKRFVYVFISPLYLANLIPKKNLRLNFPAFLAAKKQMFDQVR